MRYGVMAAAFCAAMAMPAWAGSGDLDTAFHNDGVLDLSLQTIDMAQDLATSVAGVSTVAGGCGTSYCIARYLANGDVDSSFDVDGRFAVDLTAFDDARGFAAMATSDNKYWVLANVASDGQKIIIARVNSDGKLDTTFDTDGVAYINLNGEEVIGERAVIDSLGRIYIAGTAKVYPGDITHSLFIARLNSAGVLDPIFYGSGKNFLTLTANDQVFTPSLDQFLMSPGGKLILSGHSTAFTDNIGFVLRFNFNGTYDTGFNSTGVRQIALTDADVMAVHFDVQSDERIVAVADVVKNDATKETSLTLYKADGALDTGYSTDGLDRVQPGGIALHQHRITWTPEKTLLLSGFNDSNALVITRIAADGVIGTQWTRSEISDLQKLWIMHGGQWLVLSHQQLARLVGDDRHPTEFTIARKDDQAINSTATFDPIAISGLEQIASVSFEGNAAFGVSTTNSCTAVTSFIASGTVKNGDYLCVRIGTSAEYAKETTATINVGDYSTTMTAKTSLAPTSSGGGGGGAMWPFALLFVVFARRLFKR